MSYDIRVWTCKRPELSTEILPFPGWSTAGGDWSLSGRVWQVVINGPCRCEEEDVPEEVDTALPGIRWLTELNLQAASTPVSAQAKLLRIANAIAKNAYGVIEDPQEDSLSLPIGVKRYTRQTQTERFSMLEFSWFLCHEFLRTDEGLDEVIDLFKRSLPEALPKRYGFFEPPQYVLTETGEAHYRQFLKEHKNEMLVIYTNRPVMDVTFGNHDPPAPRKWRGEQQSSPYWPNKLSVSIEKSALEQTGWAEHLKRFWERMSRLLRPYYAEVRTLDGYIRGRGSRYWTDGSTKHAPGMPWYGVPRELAHEAVLGSPYKELWPEFCASATGVDGLAFLSAGDWRLATNVGEQIGGVPDRIAQPAMPEERPVNLRGLLSGHPPTVYTAPVYPFDKPPFWPLREGER